MVEGLNKRTLHKLYIKEKKSLREIGKIFGFSRTTIQKKCRQYGIKTREPWTIKGVAKVMRTIYLDVEQIERLRKLSAQTKVPQAVYIREGIDLVLNRHLKKTRKKKGKQAVKHNKNTSLSLLKG
jgi:hypothetical protein